MVISTGHARVIGKPRKPVSREPEEYRLLDIRKVKKVNQHLYAKIKLMS